MNNCKINIVYQESDNGYINVFLDGYLNAIVSKENIKSYNDALLSITAHTGMDVTWGGLGLTRMDVTY